MTDRASVKAGRALYVTRPSTRREPDGPPDGPLASALLALSFVALIVVIVVALVGFGERRVAVATDVYLAAAALSFAFVCASPRRGGVSLIATFFFLFFVAVPTRVQVADNVFPFFSSYTSPQLAGGLLVVAVAHLAFLVGLTAPILQRRRSPSSRKLAAPPARHVVRVAAFIGVLTAIMAAYVGPGLLFATRSEFSESVAVVTGIKAQVLLSARSLSLYAVLLCIHVWRSDPPRRTQPHFLALLLLVTAGFGVLNYPPALPRFVLLGAVCSIAAMVITWFSVRWKLVFAVAAPAFLFFLFPVIKLLGLQGRITESDFASLGVRNYLTRVDFDAFKQTIDTQLFIAAGGDRDGENFLSVLLFWVPRSLWESKPLPTGQVVSESLGYVYTNVSSPLWAESLVSFGMVGVVVVMLISGVFVGRLESTVRSLPSAGAYPLTFVLYALSMGFATILMRGALGAVAPMLASAYLAYFLTTRLTPSTSTESEMHDAAA